MAPTTIPPSWKKDPPAEPNLADAGKGNAERDDHDIEKDLDTGISYISNLEVTWRNMELVSKEGFSLL